MSDAILFFSLLTVLSAIGVVFTKKPLNSALYLVLTLFLVAVHFAILGAGFLAVIQVLVYAGAIMVLVIFVIMLLGMDTVTQSAHRIVPLSIAFAFSIVFFLVFRRLGLPNIESVGDLPDNFGSIELVGHELFTKYVFPFELASVLLLAAMIGAVILAMEPKRPLAPGRGLSAMHKEADSQQVYSQRETE